MAHQPDPATLPHNDLLELRSRIKKHVKSLNDSGKLSEDPDKVSAATILKVLGVDSRASHTAADAWLCSCDTNTKP
jgi:hypothetical protein